MGHSMGAHMAGMVGKKTEEKSGKKIGRITGMDPASPGFEGKSYMLKKEYADLVDVIHTNAGKIKEGDVGIEKPIGTVDFYPNGGKHMPNCPKEQEKKYESLTGKILGKFKKAYDVVKKLLKTKCSHQQVRFYYEDSIRNRKKSNYLMSTVCGSYEDFIDGKCRNGQSLPMGESLTLEM